MVFQLFPICRHFFAFQSSAEKGMTTDTHNFQGHHATKVNFLLYTRVLIVSNKLPETVD